MKMIAPNIAMPIMKPMPHETLKTWAKRYRHQCRLYALIGELPQPSGYYSNAIHVTRQTICMFNALRGRLIADIRRRES